MNNTLSRCQELEDRTAFIDSLKAERDAVEKQLELKPGGCILSDRLTFYRNQLNQAGELQKPSISAEDWYAFLLEVEAEKENLLFDERRRSQVQALRNLPYDEYLKTDHWQRLRSLKLTEALNACQVCNCSDGRLEVHHRTYDRRGAEWMQDLTVLCDRCHSMFHGHNKGGAV